MSFYISKVVWLIFNPFNFFIFLNLIFIILYFTNFRKVGIFIFFINFIFILLISVFPIGKFLIYQIEKEYHSNQIIPIKLDGIIILGGATEPILFNDFNQVAVNASAERLIESAKIINDYDNTTIIFSGGSGFIGKPDLDHAKAAKFIYNKLAINTDKIIFESKSRNTYENIIFSKEICNPKKTQSWLLITSASHMKRALLVGLKNEWELIPYAVDFKVTKNFSFKPSFNFLSNLNLFQEAFHEWLGLLYYYLIDRTDKIF